MSKRHIVLSETVANADHIVRATLRNRAGATMKGVAGTTVKGVVCGVFLPKRLTDPIKLRFQPTPTQAGRLNLALLAARLPELSFSAATRYGNRRIAFSADRVWCSGISTGARYGIPYVTDFSAEATDFHITHSGIGAPARRQGTFSLTPNTLINTAMLVSHSYTGSVKIRHVVRPRFSLRNGVRLTFTQHFAYQKGERGETISFSELAAEFRITRRPLNISDVGDDFDDFLLLTSFAARHRCVWLGWTYTDSRGNLVQHYRRDIAIPKEKGTSRNDTLIDISDFPSFIRAAYRRFCTFAEKDQLSTALYPLISDADKTTEMSYFSLFSAFESALLFADRTFNIFPKGHSPLHKRWSLFNARFGVDLSDLWPLTDKTDGITLAQLRNKVAHGEYLNPAQTLALLYAREHLRWALERAVLSLLGWPVSRSKVRPTYLGHVYPYRNWKQTRAAF